MLNLIRLQCETCRGDFRIDETTHIATCKSCGNQYFFKDDKSDELIDSLNIANEYLHRHDFDNAITHFSGLQKNHLQDPDVAWGLTMSTYGIVWEKDDRSGEIIPTCSRVVKESILDSAAYRIAISECADEQREIYTARARYIDRLQKKIKRDMELEEDFDVFISFKAKNSDGTVTEDSVIARRIYDELTKRGIKTFFSEITLKGRIGDEYEPIIYRALFSCKFFILIATSESNINAVWVKNEWTRFRDRAEEEHLSNACCTVFKNNRHLLNLPRMFQTQGVDLNKYPAGGYEIVLADNLSEKLGITKKASIDEETFHSMEEKLQRLEKTTQYTSTNKPNNASLYDRGMLFLEDGDWVKATTYFEKSLDTNPYHALSYVGLMLSQRHLKNAEDLSKSSALFDNDPNYQKALRFADDDLKKQLLGISNQLKEGKYVTAIQNKNTNTIVSLQQAIAQFTKISSYKDSMQQAQECQRIIFEIREDSRRRALKKQFNEVNEISGQANSLEQIKKTLFEHLSDFKKNDTKREYEGQICRMYSQKINDLVSERCFGNSLNLTCTVIQYEDLDIVDRNMGYLICLDRELVDAIERSADITQAEIVLPNEIDLADPNLSSWNWCLEAIDVVISLPECEVFYGKDVIRDPISAFCLENTEYELSDSERAYIEKYVKKPTDLGLISEESARAKAREYVNNHPYAIITTDSVRATFFNYQHTLELEKEDVKRKRRKTLQWIKFSVWVALVLGCVLWLLIARPNIHGTLTQAGYVNKLWPNIWRTALILAGEIVALVVLGALVDIDDYDVFHILPKSIPTILVLYIFFTFDISSISKGYALPFYISAIGCIILTALFEFEDVFAFLRLRKRYLTNITETDSGHNEMLLFCSRYTSLIPVGMLFVYTKAFLILSIPAIWIITIPLVIALIVYVFV